MRLEIKSTDRIGISQEILSIFSEQAWDINAIEVVSCFTYIHVERTCMPVNEVMALLVKVNGVISCRMIDLLPTERREKHLQTLLDRMPDPIIDIDAKGKILAMNQATRQMLIEQEYAVEQYNISELIVQDYQSLLTDKRTCCNMTFLGLSYVAEATPVFSEQRLSGAVVIFRTMKTVGQQISLLQTPTDHGVENIVGQSAKMRTLVAQTLRYAELELPVMISGETGTGKELIARALHNASHRAKAPFLAINCAALPEHLLESELFGYAPGAFTGAQKGGKPGLFELANGGSIFLDEIAEMSVYLQAKLLRFLQDFRYRRLGGTKELCANVRIISASHQNIMLLLEQKLFREDLFYRLNVLSIALPPLRERTEDIPLLSELFINNAALQVNQTSPVLTESALAELIGYHWPGNIRQLQNILFRVVALNVNAQLDAEDIKKALVQFTTETDEQPSIDANLKSWAQAQAEFERQLLITLYPLYPSTRKLAERLQVSHNKIAMKLKKYGLLKAAFNHQ